MKPSDYSQYLSQKKGFVFHTPEFNEGYIDDFCENSTQRRVSDADDATLAESLLRYFYLLERSDKKNSTTREEMTKN